MATIIFTDKVIDLNAARAALTARPLQGRLLKSVAASMDGTDRTVLRAAIADGFARGLTTAEITRSVLRDQVRAKARAAL